MSEPSAHDDSGAVDGISSDDLLPELMDDFLDRHRAGERPSLDEYTSKYPNLATRILELFPLMLEMEQRAASPTLDAAASAERVGATIGRYKLLERIGEGGFGVVYMAEQTTPVRRKVALKVIKPGVDTRQVIARFEAERQALALMDHENIARVLDAGATGSGRPYFVMELVHGVPITEYCDRNELSPRERLELFVQVCRAVQHAHTKGIIHRDIKPTNVLVTLHEGVAVPKVIDFGVAKATGQQLTEKTLFTNFAQMIGTPLYMSPEQAEMTGVDTDTRSDVYSLGVLLYELLTGTTPLDKERLKKSAFDEIRRIIREEEPPRPSTRLSTMGEQLRTISARRKCEPAQLGRIVRGELDWIVMRALEKERSRRYETANGLARDIERYLQDEAVEACPPSAGYRFRKWIRRHKRFAALLLVSTFFLLLFAVSSAIAAAVFRQQKEQQRELAGQNARLANKNQLLADEREVQLADTYTVLGQSSLSWNARAALWFANSALTSRSDPDRVQASLLRVKYALQGQWVPVAAVGQKDIGNQNANQTAFDPENSRYLMTFTQYGRRDVAQLWDLLTERLLQPPAGLEPLASAAWAPGGKVVLGSTTGRIALASIPDLKILQQWDAGGPVKRVAASSDGRMVVATSGKKLLAWATSGDADPAIFEHDAELVYVGFSPTGEYLVTATESDSKARAFSVTATASTPVQLRPTLGPVTHVFRGPGDDYFTRPPVVVEGGRELLAISDPGTPSRPGTFKRYDIATGAETATVKDPLLHKIRDLAASPDGRTFAMSSSLYSAATNKASQWLINTLGQAFSPNGNYFANSNAGLEVFKTEPGKTASRTFPLVNLGGRPAFSADGKYLAILHEGIVQVLQIPTNTAPSPLFPRVDLKGRGSFGAFSRDGQFLMSIGNVNVTNATVRTIQVFAAATGKPVGKALSLDANLVGADFSPDGQLVAAVTGAQGDPKQLRLWHWQTGALVWAPFTLESEPVSTCFAPDGKAVAVHCINGAALLIDAVTGNELLRVQCRETRTDQGSYPWQCGRGTIAFSHDGRIFFTWGSPVVQAWDRETGHERFAVRHTQNCWSCAQSPDGRILATGSFDGNLCFWNAENGQEVRPPIEHPNQVLSIDFSPDGRLIGTACLDWQTRVWEVSTGRLAYGMPPDGSLTDLRFTPDSRFAINAGAGGIQLWDARTGFAVSPRLLTENGANPHLDITRDGHRALAAGIVGRLSIVDLQSLTSIANVPPEETLLWCELLANSHLAGSTLVNLTDAEWLERWRHYRRLHPEFRPMAAEQ